MSLRTPILRKTRPSSPLVGALAAVGVWAGGCSGSEPEAKNGTTATDTGTPESTVDVTLFELTVRIVLPLNQGTLFDDVDRLDIVVTQAGAEVGRYSMEDLAQGEVGRGADELPELSGAVILLEGFDEDGKVIAYGKSGPVYIADGTDDVTIFVAQADAFGWLYSLANGAAGSTLVADHEGDVLMFGGTVKLTSVDAVRAQASNSVRRLDLTDAENGLVFSTVGSMPLFSGTLEEHGRAEHTATRLGGTHDNQDLILVAGGSTDFYDSSEITDHAFLWDPTTDSVVDEGAWLSQAQSHHVAVADAAGNVVLSGGSGPTGANNSYSPHDVLHFFDGVSLEMERIEQPTTERPWVHHAGAALDDRGVLLCGGLRFPQFEEDYAASAGCALVSSSGAYTGVADSGISLPTALLHHAMIDLDDGSVLVTGGATYDSGVYTVTNEAWVLDPSGTTWTPVGPMHMTRALHSMTRLPDGRVVVVGGVTAMSSHWWRGENAVACAEVFNPVLGDFVEVGVCTAESADGALPGIAAQPAIATEPVRGMAVVVGGYNADNDGVTGAAVYLPPVSD